MCGPWPLIEAERVNKTINGMKEEKVADASGETAEMLKASDNTGVALHTSYCLNKCDHI